MYYHRVCFSTSRAKMTALITILNHRTCIKQVNSTSAAEPSQLTITRKKGVIKLVSFLQVVVRSGIFIKVGICHTQTDAIYLLSPKALAIDTVRLAISTLGFRVVSY